MENAQMKLEILYIVKYLHTYDNILADVNQLTIKDQSRTSRLADICLYFQIVGVSWPYWRWRCLPLGPCRS